MPEFGIGLLAVMVSGGILGGFAGRMVNKRMDAEMVGKLFMGLMILIMLICVYNMIRLM